MNNNKSRLMIVLSMAMFGTLAPFVRNIPVASGELALYRAVLASAIIAVFMIATRQKLPINSIRKELPMLILSGAGMGVNWILLFEAYKYTTVSVATLSYYFAPVIVTAVCPFLFKEKLTKKQIVCFLMSTLGIILITGIGEMSGGSQHLKGIIFALGAAVLFKIRKGARGRLVHLCIGTAKRLVILANSRENGGGQKTTQGIPYGRERMVAQKKA